MIFEIGFGMYARQQKIGIEGRESANGNKKCQKGLAKDDADRYVLRVGVHLFNCELGTIRYLQSFQRVIKLQIGKFGFAYHVCGMSEFEQN